MKKKTIGGELFKTLAPSGKIQDFIHALEGTSIAVGHNQEKKEEIKPEPVRT